MTLRKLLVLIALLITLTVSAGIAFAQDATPAPETTIEIVEEAPAGASGLTVLIFLVGVAAVGGAGMLGLLFSRAQNKP
jgi:hypothetical protein